MTQHICDFCGQPGSHVDYEACTEALLERVAALQREVHDLRFPRPVAPKCPAGILPVYALALCPDKEPVLFFYGGDLFVSGRRDGDRVYTEGGLLEYDTSDFDGWTPMPAARARAA